MNDTTPQRVLLADGDAGVRRALALLLQTVLGFEIGDFCRTPRKGKLTEIG